MLFPMVIAAVLGLSVLGQRASGYQARQGTVLRGLKVLTDFGANNVRPVEHLR